MVKSVNPNSGVKGMDIVLANLNKEIAKIKGKSMAGMIESAILIRRDMEKTPPKIPLRTGNLRASWFTVTSKSRPEGRALAGFKGEGRGEMEKEHMAAAASGKQSLGRQFGVIMGFSANYAVFVHEMVDRGGGINWKRAGSGPKFLEAAMRRNAKKILGIIRRNATIKP